MWLQNLIARGISSRSCLHHMMCRNCSTDSAEPLSPLVPVRDRDKAEVISKAMLMYLERAKKHEEFVSERKSEYELGKRHLANIMSADPDNFTQLDIDRSIAYLFPSGLFSRRSRPFMKPPEVVFPIRKAAQFGPDGRPFHYLFYTCSPNFWDVINKLSMKILHLRKQFDDSRMNGNVVVAEETLADISLRRFLPKETLEDKFVEKISDDQYNHLLKLLQTLQDTPFSRLEEEILHQFSVPRMSASKNVAVKKLLVNEDGRKYSTAEGKRKTGSAKCQVIATGSGLFSVNGIPVTRYFPNITEREQILMPLSLTDKVGLVDVEVQVQGGGPSSQAGAIRLALALALRSHVEPEIIEQMRLVGLLTKDIRRVERQKPGQFGARRNYTWKKR